MAGTVNVVEKTVVMGPVVINDAVRVPVPKSLNPPCVAVTVRVPPVEALIVATRRFVGTPTFT